MTSQSKGLTEAEVRHYRNDLYAFNEAARRRLEPSVTYTVLSPEATSVAQWLNLKSKNGHYLDSQLRIEGLPDLLKCSGDDASVAVDELVEAGLAEFNGSHDVIFATDRLFWETDPLFSDVDPVADAETVAKLMVGSAEEWPDMKDIAAELGWSPRRLNPAASYLIAAGVVEDRRALTAAPFVSLSLRRTPRTVWYVRSLS